MSTYYTPYTSTEFTSTGNVVGNIQPSDIRFVYSLVFQPDKISSYQDFIQTQWINVPVEKTFLESDTISTSNVPTFGSSCTRCVNTIVTPEPIPPPIPTIAHVQTPTQNRERENLIADMEQYIYNGFDDPTQRVQAFNHITERASRFTDPEVQSLVSRMTEVIFDNSSSSFA